MVRKSGRDYTVARVKNEGCQTVFTELTCPPTVTLFLRASLIPMEIECLMVGS